MTALLADSLGGSAYSYPLATRQVKVGRFPWKFPSERVVMCSACGDRPVKPHSTLCFECAPIRAEVAQTRRVARRRVNEGQPCPVCRSVKPRGRGRLYCDQCEPPSKGSRAKATTPDGLRQCERCPNPSRTPHSKLCVDCKAEAREVNAAYKRAWFQEHGGSPSGPKSPETVRMSQRLAAERRGVALEPAPPLMRSRGSSRSRVDSEAFPPLPAGPLVAKVADLIRRTALDSVYPVDQAAAITSDRGERCAPDRLHRTGAPSAREAVCDRLGIPSRALYDMEQGIRPSVAFDTADRVLTRAGWLWWMTWEPCRSGCGSCSECDDYALARKAFEPDD